MRGDFYRLMVGNIGPTGSSEGNPIMMRWVLVFLAIGCLTACGRDKTGSEEERPIERWRLPMLSQTHHPGLKKELARLVSERATPALLMDDHRKRTTSSQGPVLDDDNVAVAMAKVCKTDMAQILLDQADDLFPHRVFEFSPLRLKKASEFRLLHNQALENFRSALARPRCDFGLKANQGLQARTGFVYPVLFGFHLEGLHAAELLQADQPEEAFDALRRMFRATQLLSGERHLVPRLAAVQMHEKAFHVLEAIANHRHATRDLQEQLAELVNKELAHWPKESDIWIAQRAMGLHTYEIVRDGFLTSLLSEGEIKNIEKRFNAPGRPPLYPIDDFATDRIRNADIDESFYLETMREIIEGCAHPYYQRTKIFKKAMKHLENERDTKEHPFVADHILRVDDIQSAHQMMAQERAFAEAWALALAAVTGREPPSFKTNPLTGRPYRVEVEDHHVTVLNIRGEIDERPLKVIRLAVENQSNSAVVTPTP